MLQLFTFSPRGTYRQFSDQFPSPHLVPIHKHHQYTPYSILPTGGFSVSNPRVLMGLPRLHFPPQHPSSPISILHPWTAPTGSPAGKQLVHLGPAFPQLSSSRHGRHFSFLRFRSLSSLLRSPPPRLSATILVCLSLTATIGLWSDFALR